MENRGVFFDADRLAESERKRETRAFAILSIVIGLAGLYNGYFEVHPPADRWDGIVTIIFGLLQFANLAVFPLHRRLELGKLGLSILALLTLITSFPTGGAGGTILMWIVAYPCATFLYFGIRNGIAMNGLFMGLIVLIQVMQRYWHLEVVFNATQYKQMWIGLVVLNIIGYVAQKGRELTSDELAHQGESLRVLLLNMPVGVMMFDASTRRILAANPHAEELLASPILADLSIDDIPKKFGLKKESGELFPVEDLPGMKKGEEGALLGRSDVFLRTPDGTPRVLRWSNATVKRPDGRIASIIAILDDATKEHEIDVMKSEFVSLASHQLKTPLTSISWGMETLEGDAGPLTEEQRSIVADVRAVVARLSHLVSDLLNVSRIDTGRKFDIVKKPTDMSAIVAGVLKDQLANIKKRNITIEDRMPPGLTLEVDEAKCYEVIANVVSNAVKYSKDAGHVEIGAKTGDGETIIFVKDDGIGIPKDQHAKLYEKFFRASNAPEDIEGTGLGLYIVRAIVEKHGGRVWFDSEEGKGTTFFLAFPTP